MLPEEIGIKNIDEFFTDIPPKILLRNLDIPKGISELEVKNRLKRILKKNISFDEFPSFFGGTLKPHYIPAAIKTIVNRSEFYTSYTPYQPEFSQGLLQTLFEYQSMMAELTGMDVINISMYDSSTALGEAALMASRITKKNDFFIPTNISWEKKSVLKNYVTNIGIKIKEIPYQMDGLIDLSSIPAAHAAGVYIENPNYFGIFDSRLNEIKELSGDAPLIVGTNPLSLALLKSPGEYGADIVIAEGQNFGNPLNFGGSLLGVFGCKKKHVRMMPGKIIGATSDKERKKAFCMTLQTREQHIRREKATSNICSNEALCAVGAVAYMASLGTGGLQALAKTNMKQAYYLASQLKNLGFTYPFNGQFFNDFVTVSPVDAKQLNNMLLKKRICGGLLLKNHFPELGEAILFGITEMHTKEIIDKLVEAIYGIIK